MALSLSVICFLAVSLSHMPRVIAQAESSVEPSEGASAQTDESSARSDPQRSRRQRRRGIAMTVIGIAMASLGVTLSIFGFDEQVESGGEVMRPLAIITLGLGLVFTGVGVSELVAGLLARDDDEVSTASVFRLRSLSLGKTYYFATM